MTSSQKKWFKWAMMVTTLVIIGFLGYYFFKPKPQQPNYITATVSKANIENSVMASGKIEAKNAVDVGAQVSGEVTHLYVEVGDEVQQGQTIAQIDPVTLRNTLSNQRATLEQSLANLESTKAHLATRQASLTSAQSDLTSKQANYEQAVKNYNRIKNLLSSNAVSQQEVEQAQTAVKTALASVNSAKDAIKTAEANLYAGQADIATAQATIKKSQTEVNTAEKNLGYTKITAPMSGTVISITTKQGQTVNANQSAPTIVTLADLKTVRIKAKISEADVINLKAGMPVYFNVIGNPDKKYTAKLSAIEPAPSGTTANSNNSETAVYYIGYFDVPNTDGILRIDMTAQVHIIQNKVDNVLSLPASAIKKDPEIGNYVQVVQADGSTKKQAVKTGLSNRVTTQIVSGVNEGDKVVISEASGNKANNNNRPPMM